MHLVRSDIKPTFAVFSYVYLHICKTGREHIITHVVLLAVNRTYLSDLHRMQKWRLSYVLYRMQQTCLLSSTHGKKDLLF